MRRQPTERGPSRCHSGRWSGSLGAVARLQASAALVGGVGGGTVPVEDADIVEQRLAVDLDRLDVVVAAVDDQPGGVRTTVRSVQGDDASGDADLAAVVPFRKRL